MRGSAGFRAALTLTAAALLAAAGCRRPPSPPPRASAAPKPERSARDYKLVGVVRQVNPKAGVVTIRHEAIAGFMDAMTMPFTLKDPGALDDVRPGDEVEGTLRVEREGGEVKDYALTGLSVVRPAPAPALTLSLSGGAAEVKPAARLLRPGDPVPDFTMTTQDGASLRLSDLRGKVVALTFIYTRCPLPDFCPRMDRKFAELADRAAAVPGRSEHVRLLSVSFDPEHDTPGVLRAHAASQGAKPPLWTFAVATHAELAKVAGPLGLTYGPARGEVIHNLSAAVIGPDGRLAALETGPAARDWTPAEVLKVMYSRIPGSKG